MAASQALFDTQNDPYSLEIQYLYFLLGRIEERNITLAIATLYMNDTNFPPSTFHSQYQRQIDKVSNKELEKYKRQYFEKISKNNLTDKSNNEVRGKIYQSILTASARHLEANIEAEFNERFSKLDDFEISEEEYLDFILVSVQREIFYQAAAALQSIEKQYFWGCLIRAYINDRNHLNEFRETIKKHYENTWYVEFLKNYNLLREINEWIASKKLMETEVNAAITDYDNENKDRERDETFNLLNREFYYADDCKKRKEKSDPGVKPDPVAWGFPEFNWKLHAVRFFDEYLKKPLAVLTQFKQLSLELRTTLNPEAVTDRLKKIINDDSKPPFVGKLIAAAKIKADQLIDQRRKALEANSKQVLDATVTPTATDSAITTVTTTPATTETLTNTATNTANNTADNTATNTNTNTNTNTANVTYNSQNNSNTSEEDIKPAPAVEKKSKKDAWHTTAFKLFFGVEVILLLGLSVALVGSMVGIAALLGVALFCGAAAVLYHSPPKSKSAEQLATAPAKTMRTYNGGTVKAISKFKNGVLKKEILIDAAPQETVLINPNQEQLLECRQNPNNLLTRYRLTPVAPDKKVNEYVVVSKRKPAT